MSQSIQKCGFGINAATAQAYLSLSSNTIIQAANQIGIGPPIKRVPWKISHDGFGSGMRWTQLRPINQQIDPLQCLKGLLLEIDGKLSHSTLLGLDWIDKGDS